MIHATCNKCGRTRRRVRPSLIIINGEIVIPDDSDNEKVWVCLDPNCRSANS